MAAVSSDTPSPVRKSEGEERDGRRKKDEREGWEG
jgi:hypothetical protein